MKGFAKAFGDEALETLRRTLTEPLPEIETLPAAEFPIIFLPRPGGGDIQATPLAPAEAYVRFGEVTEPYFRKNEEGQPPAPRGQWRRQFVADKPQNISGAVGKQRRRFFAKMPRVLDRWSAELHRYAHGGRFPLWRDDDVVDAVFAYADLLDTSAKYSNQDIRAELDRRADALIRTARDFVDETLADAKAEHPESDLPVLPSIYTVIIKRQWKHDGYDRARRVLTSDHFKTDSMLRGSAEMLFLAKKLKASRVNLLMNDFAAGLPSPLAFLGLGAAIAPALGAPRWSVGVLPILHSVDVFEGRTKAEAAPARKSGVFAPIEIPEDLIGAVSVSLFLDVPECADGHRVADAASRPKDSRRSNRKRRYRCLDRRGRWFRVQRRELRLRDDPGRAAEVLFRCDRPHQ